VKILSAALVICLFALPAARADDAVDRGALVFRKCQSCHKVGPDARNGVGPHLNGLFGRRAASVEGFPYSDGLRRAAAGGLEWHFETLHPYIENPKKLVSDTRMNFAGIMDETDRDDLLAYLRTFSDNPRDIVEADPTTQHDPKLSDEILGIVGDPAYGEYLSGECATCHQADGSDQGIPSITGWPEEDFVIALHAYKNKERAHPVMQMMAGRLSNEEIAALAAYFRQLN